MYSLHTYTPCKTNLFLMIIVDLIKMRSIPLSCPPWGYYFKITPAILSPRRPTFKGRVSEKTCFFLGFMAELFSFKTRVKVYKEYLKIPSRAFLKLAGSIERRSNNYNYLCTCDLYTPVHNVLKAWIYITWGS